MKKLIKVCLACFMAMALVACSNKDEFQMIDISATELQEKLDNKENFMVIVEREECGFCEQLSEYIEQTKNEHPNLVLYRLDSTDFKFTRESEESTQLQSETEDGKILLEMAPYFLYTPTIYVVKDGKPVLAGIGFMEDLKHIYKWTVNSTINFETAETVEFWQFLEENQ